MDEPMKNYLIIIVLVLTSGVSAQVSFNAGGSLLKGFGAPEWFTGFHAGVEIPRDDALSFYGRVTHHFQKKANDPIDFYATAIDFSTSPNILLVQGLPSMNFTIIEGGSRFYLGDGFDFGFAAYGGTNFMLVLNKVKVTYDDFDDQLYAISDLDRVDGKIFGLGAGLAGGVKYSVPRLGTFYFDLSVSYMFLAQGSQQNVYSDLYSSLLFNMALGYRYDIVW
ncbi:MAG: hypothetical protein ACI865_000590 [Flavobacteriaceae bacterium]|jgi:hypothetical protein